ncbi:MAG: hypothetical protein IKA05_04565 [Clostridia bacterium]|nr:hypothetical protein [Clostridia bacterium]
MKKRILTMLLSALLVANISSCSYVPEDEARDSQNNVISQTTDGNTEKNNISSNTGSTIDFKVLAEPIYLVPHWQETTDGQRYIHFLEHMEQNAYDQWLNAELLNGNQPVEDVYKEYLALWKNEIAFAVKQGESFCKSYPTEIITPQRYDGWKGYVEQWLLSADNLLEVEQNLLEQAEISPLGALVSHCMLIRQQAIGIKEFIYYLEVEGREIEACDLHSVSIEWAPEASGLIREIDQDKSTPENANIFSSNFEISTFFNNFRDRVTQSFEDQILKNSFSKLDTDTLNIDRDIFSIYFNNKVYWECNEGSATLAHGKAILEDLSDYEQWDGALEQLLSTTDALLTYESCFFVRDLTKSTIWKCTIVREVVLDSKFFLYYLEYQQKASDGVESIEVEIKWSTKG